jgi:iron complex transport system permease protein
MIKTDSIQEKYKKYTQKKIFFGLFLIILLFIAAIYSICVGSMHLTIKEVINGLIYAGDGTNEVVIWNIRFPRILAAVIAGMSLAVAGCVMQCVLRNPLASPFTMGISQGAAFGAAFAIIVLGMGEIYRTDTPVILNNPYIVTIFAFMGSLIGIFIILLLARLTGLSPQAMILAGIAMGSLFSAGTMLLQYFAEDVKVASVVFWTFGDIGRAGRNDILIMLFVAIPALIYFIYKRWDYNALESGEETAKALGVDTERVRFLGILISALITSISVAFLGIIGFIGLVAPHIMRRIIGGDHRFLVPMSAMFGGVLLLAADTVARTIISPVMLPVGILTSFMGVPLFIYLLIRKRREY